MEEHQPLLESGTSFHHGHVAQQHQLRERLQHRRASISSTHDENSIERQFGHRFAQQFRNFVDSCPAGEIPEGTIHPLCDCGFPTKLIVDNISYPGFPVNFWVCALGHCPYHSVPDFEPVEEISQVVEAKWNVHSMMEHWDLQSIIGDSVIDNIWIADRYVSLYNVMGWFGDAFSANFFKRIDTLKVAALRKAKADGVVMEEDNIVVYPKGSKGLNVYGEYDGFV